MNYKISKEQNEKLMDLISSILKNNMLSESNLVCDLRVYPIDEIEEKEHYDKGFRYDIFIYLNFEVLKIYNASGQQILRNGVGKRVSELLNSWLKFIEGQYMLNFFVKDC